MHILFRHSQRSSEGEKHCLCGFGGVDEVWSSGPRVEESVLRHQPQRTLPGNGLANYLLLPAQAYKQQNSISVVLLSY